VVSRGSAVHNVALLHADLCQENERSISQSNAPSFSTAHGQKTWLDDRLLLLLLLLFIYLFLMP